MRKPYFVIRERYHKTHKTKGNKKRTEFITEWKSRNGKYLKFNFYLYCDFREVSNLWHPDI